MDYSAYSTSSGSSISGCGQTISHRLVVTLVTCHLLYKWVRRSILLIAIVRAFAPDSRRSKISRIRHWAATALVALAVPVSATVASDVPLSRTNF